MSFLFGRARTRTNVSDLPRQAREHVVKLEGPQGAAKVEELAKVLSQMKQLLQGTHGMLLTSISYTYSQLFFPANTFPHYQNKKLPPSNNTN